MFTGIIETTGNVTALEGSDQSGSLKVLVASKLSELVLGESIALNGVCLTVDQPGRLSFFVSRETLDKTALSELKVGSRVNLERALLPTTRLSGHYVQGHVDGIGKFERSKIFKNSGGDSHELWFSIPKSLLRYVVVKGSISLNGVSLTVNEIDDSKSEIQVHIIPHTWENTQLSELRVNESVNVEVDVIAKYVERISRFSNA